MLKPVIPVCWEDAVWAAWPGGMGDGVLVEVGGD